MTSEIYYSILSKIEVIEKTEKLIKDLKAVEEDDFGVNYCRTYELRKRFLIKDLLKDLIDADIKFSDFKKLYRDIFSYLEDGKNDASISRMIRKNANRLEQSIAVR